MVRVRKAGFMRLLSMVMAVAVLAVLTVSASAGSVLVAMEPVAAWDGSSTAQFTWGDGSRDNPYRISNAEQLAYFRDRVNSGNSSICAYVVADIDLGNHEWTPIGLTKSGYNGIFDGGGWEIKNMRLTKVSNKIKYQDVKTNKSHTLQVSGLFGCIGSNGVVRNVNVSGIVTGKISLSNDTGVYLGGVAGNSFGSVEECFNTCNFTDLSIKNDDYVGIGSIVGVSQVGSVIKNCYNVGTIDASVTVNAGHLNVYAGGITGYQMGELSNCYSAAPLQIKTNSRNLRLGGITGVSYSADKLRNSFFDRQLCTVTQACSGSTWGYNDKPLNPNDCGSYTSEQMKTSNFVNVLGNAFALDTQKINNGYPILSVMTYGQKEDWSSWYEEEIDEDIAKEAYDKLMPDELVSKDLTKPITRVEFSAVAVNLYEERSGRKIPLPDASEVPFEDTSSDAVAKAWSVGITNGTDGTGKHFNPYALISREDLATMLTRVYKSLYIDGWTLDRDSEYKLDYSGVTPFSDDAKISSYAKPSVYFMVKNNIIKGMTPTTFAPRNLTSVEKASGYANASREQAMIMAVRAFTKLEPES